MRKRNLDLPADATPLEFLEVAFRSTAVPVETRLAAAAAGLARAL
jgi:hypothetical protein